MADTSRLYNSSGVADLICYPRWLIAVDYITQQVQQIYQAYQICSTQQKGLGLTADLMFHTHQSKAEDLSIIWDVIESKALACNLKIGKGGGLIKNETTWQLLPSIYQEQYIYSMSSEDIYIYIFGSILILCIQNSLEYPCTKFIWWILSRAMYLQQYLHALFIYSAFIKSYLQCIYRGLQNIIFHLQCIIHLQCIY